MAGRVVVGIDIGGTKTLSAVVDAQGRVLARHRIETPQRGPQDFVQVLARELSTLLGLAGLQKEDLLGLGVGAPGPLDPETGGVFEPPNLAGWRDVPVGTMLFDATGVPTFVENDANAAALGEAWVGAGVGVRDQIYITVSTGIGGGLIFNGELYHGVSGTAGEIGHMTVEPDGPVCTCGRRGHLEGLASGQAIARTAEEAVRAGRQTRLAALPSGALDAAVVAQAALAPAMVVFGGGVSKVGDLLFDTVRRVVRERAFERPAEAAKIVPAALGDDVGVIGAAAGGDRRAGS